jgi:hypothetical protein
MVEVRLLAPYQEHAAESVIDVDVETAEALRAAGKASLTSMEQASAEVPGHYTDVTGRDDVAPLGGGGVPGPQADEPDEPKSKKGKK